MNPAMLLLIIQGVQAAIAAAPQVADLAVKAKDFFTAMFSAGLITADQQNKIHAHVDAICAAAAAGAELPEWTVEPDPAS